MVWLETKKVFIVLIGALLNAIAMNFFSYRLMYMQAVLQEWHSFFQAFWVISDQQGYCCSF